MSKKPLVIAGPCAAESPTVLNEAAKTLRRLADELGFEPIFKSSFDKANRTSLGSSRGPDMDKALGWLDDVKNDYNFRILTDIHEPWQAEPAAKVCDYLQIPAFLCRQTDLVVAAARTSKNVNIKKGQFMAPGAMKHITGKVRATFAETKASAEVYLTERGASFGYGDLVVDMRGLSIMADAGDKIIFDITHSTQKPPSDGATSGGNRCFAPILARAAAATGYLSGFFLEIHPDPKSAISDKDAQLSFNQAATLLRQLIPLWRDAQEMQKIDRDFKD